MTYSATLRRSDWNTRSPQSEWTKANYKPTKAGVMMDRTTERPAVYITIRFGGTRRRQVCIKAVDIHETVAAYQAVAKQKQPIIHAVAEQNQQTFAQNIAEESLMQEPTESIFGTLQLYTGLLLFGAVIGGLSFGWTGHREASQVIGGLLAMLGYFILGNRKLHGTRG